MIKDMSGMDEIKEVFSYLALHEQKLSLSEIDFVRSLKKYFTRNKKLSERQKTALFEIRKFMQS